MSKAKARERDLLTELTPEHALMNLFASDEWPVEADAESAARIIVQWLRDSGFDLTDATRR